VATRSDHHTVTAPDTRPARAAERTGPPDTAWRPVLSVAGVLGLALLLTSGRVGYFGDELYFVVAGRHLDWSYVDQGPLLPLLARLMDVLAPGSMVATRLPVTVLTAIGVVLTAQLAREFGGARTAQFLAAITYAMAFAVPGHLLMTSTVDPFLWLVLTWLLVRWVRLREDRLLLLAALVTAVALQNKWQIGAFWVVAGVCLLIAGPRELLLRPALWIGAVVAGLTLLPSLLWQARYDWPYLALTRVIAGEVDSDIGGRWLFVPLMLTSAGVGIGLFVYCYGLVRLLRSADLREYRFLGYTLIGLVALFIACNGRFYYMSGMVPLALATGAVGLERRAPRGLGWVMWRPVVALNVVFALITLPVLPTSWPTPAAPFSAATLGWPELTRTVADAYRALPPDTRAHTAILTDAYWDASAIDRYGPDLGLPRPFSPHRGYWYFGTPPQDTATVLFVGSDPGALGRYFVDVHQVGTTAPRSIYGPAAVWLCDGPRQPWSQLWPAMRRI
jgi:hypothetical protein